MLRVERIWGRRQVTSTEVAIQFFEKHLKDEPLKYGERQAIHMAISALREPKLPCKPGDTVYRLCGQRGCKYVAERKVVSVALCGEQSWQILTTVHDWLGHNVFLTREEAEAKLRRLEEV